MQVARVTFMGSPPEWNGMGRYRISNIDGQTTKMPLPMRSQKLQSTAITTKKNQHETQKHNRDVYELVTKGKASEEGKGTRTITGIHPYATSYVVVDTSQIEWTERMIGIRLAAAQSPPKTTGRPGAAAAVRTTRSSMTQPPAAAALAPSTTPRSC